MPAVVLVVADPAAEHLVSERLGERFEVRELPQQNREAEELLALIAEMSGVTAKFHHEDAPELFKLEAEALCALSATPVAAVAVCLEVGIEQYPHSSIVNFSTRGVLVERCLPTIQGRESAYWTLSATVSMPLLGGSTSTPEQRRACLMQVLDNLLEAWVANTSGNNSISEKMKSDGS